MNYRSRSCGVCLAAALPLVPSFAGAAGESASASGVLDEVVVTVTRTAERLQDLPLAVTALSAAELQNMGVQDLKGLNRGVPGLVITESPGGGSTPMYFLRGNGTDNDVFTLDPAIGVYVDGVYYARMMGTMIPFYDLERVEVLRGPQGTLYGRNTVQGAMRITTRAPSLERWTGGAEIIAGDYSRLDVKGSINGPLSDKVAMSLSAITRKRDGIMDNLTTGGTAADKDEIAARAALLLKPADALSITLRGDLYRDRSMPTAPSSLANNPDGDVLTYESAMDGPYNKVDTRTGSVTAEWAVSDGFDLTAVTAYRSMDMDLRFDFDGSALSRFETNRQVLQSRQFSQELYGVWKRVGDLPLDLTAGLFYYTEDADQTLDMRLPPPLRFPIPLIEQETTSKAVYGQAKWHMSPQLTFTGGVRYTDEGKDLTGEDTIPDQSSEGLTFERTALNIDTRRWTYSGALDYRLNDSVLLYASIATGFKSGGYDGSQLTDEDFLGSRFDIETNRTWEIGVKTDWLDRRLRLNLDYYRSRVQSLQRSVMAESAQGGFTTINLNADIDGFEAELAAIPADGLTLTAAAAVVNTNIDGYPGVELPKSPGLTAHLALDYQYPLASGGKLLFNTDVNYTGSYFTSMPSELTATAVNHPATRNDAFHIWNASVGYASANDRWRIRAGVNNINDHVYYSQVFNFSFAPSTVFPSEPRMWFVSLQANF